MATNVSFTWQTHPSEVAGNVASYAERVLQGIFALADVFAARMEAAAKGGAPWSDRTGAARQGLRGFAVKEATRVVLYLVTSVKYGVYLELGTSKMAPRPIIMPTLERNFAPLMSAVRGLIGG